MKTKCSFKYTQAYFQSLSSLVALASYSSLLFYLQQHVLQHRTSTAVSTTYLFLVKV